MKPSVFIAAVLAISPLTLHAESDIMWGARATFDINLPTKWKSNETGFKMKMYKPGLGVSLGAVCNIWLGNNFYFEPGVSLFYDNYDYDNVIISNEPFGQSEIIKSLYKVGLRVPIVTGYTIDFSDRFGMSIYTGPQFSYAFAGDNRIDAEHLDKDIDWSLFGEGGQRRFEMGWKVGVAFPIDSWAIGIEGNFGLTNVLKETWKCRENRVVLTLTRYF